MMLQCLFRFVFMEVLNLIQMKLSIVLAISHYRKQTLDLAATFTVDGRLCHCHNIDGLFQKLSETHIGDERRFFSNS